MKMEIKMNSRKNRMQAIFGTAIMLVLSISSSVGASVSQCTDASTAFEALLQNYNQCIYGASSDACSSFCSGAGSLVAVTPPPAPVNPCQGPNAWQIDQSDLSIAIPGSTPAHAFGSDQRDCVQNALSSTTAYNLEQSCNQQAQCIQNCTAYPNGPAQMGDVTATPITLTAEVNKKDCKGNPSICESECANQLQTGYLVQAQNNCVQSNSVASCTVTITGTIHQYGLIGGTGHFRCDVTATVRPNAAVSCSVPIKAVNQSQYGGHHH